MKKIFTLMVCALAAMAVNAQTIFSFTLKEGISNKSVGAGEDYELVDSIATIEGDYTYVVLHNGHGSNPKDMIVSGAINLNGSGGSYVGIKLGAKNTLMEGDKIVLTASKDGGEISFTESKTGSDNVTNYTYTVPATNAGGREIYIFRGGSKPTITGVKVIREGNKVKAPVFTYADGKVSITSSTENATIMYGTEKGNETNTYSEAITVTQTTTFYAIAKADGLDNSDEVEFQVIKVSGTPAATIAGKADMKSGEADEVIASATDNGYTIEDTDAQDDDHKNNIICYSVASKSNGDLRPAHFKVKGTLKVSAPTGKKLTGIKVYGVANNDTDPITVTVADMATTSGFNKLPSRATTDDMPCVEFAYVGESELTSTTITFSNQARVYFEIFADEAAGINNIAATTASAKAKKYVKNGQLVIETAKGTFSVVGARVK